MLKVSSDAFVPFFVFFAMSLVFDQLHAYNQSGFSSLTLHQGRRFCYCRLRQVNRCSQTTIHKRLNFVNGGDKFNRGLRGHQ